MVEFKFIIIIIIIIIVALSQILSTLQIISHLVRHKPTKWISDNQHCCYIYIYRERERERDAGKSILAARRDDDDIY